MNGAIARSLVEEGNKKGNENATIPNLVEVEKFAKEKTKIQSNAILSTVDVSFFFFLSYLKVSSFL